MRGEQVSRQWQVLQELESHSPVHPERLAKKFGVSPRTIYRDLETLKRVGFPIVSRRPLGYGLAPDQPIPQLRFSPSELISLHLANLLLPTPIPESIRSGLKSAWAKIEAVTPKELIPYLKALNRSFQFQRYPRLIDSPDLIYQIQSAINDQRSVELSYFSIARNRLTQRVVDPYGLYSALGKLYLIGHCHHRKEVRIFAIERIRSLKLLSQGFVRPPDFSLEEYMRGSFGIFRGPRARVRVQFDKKVARWVVAKEWQPGQRIKRLSRGRIELEFEVSGLQEVRSWILSFGAHARVIAPAHLKRSIAREAARLNRIYGPQKP